MPKAKYLTADKAYKLIMECYQSGLTTKQWLIENEISQSTFYKWVRKFRSGASGYNIPPRSKSTNIRLLPKAFG